MKKKQELKSQKSSKLKEVLSKPIFNKEKPKVDTSESNKNVNTPIYSPNSIFDSYDEDISIDDLPKLK